jgi:hypothetical protein
VCERGREMTSPLKKCTQKSFACTQDTSTVSAMPLLTALSLITITGYLKLANISERVGKPQQVSEM